MMLSRRVFALVVVSILTVAAAAQDAPQLRVFNTPASNTYADGTAGTIRTDALTPWTSAGIQLLAGSAPDIVAQIGDVSTASFSILAANQSAPLFRILRSGNAAFGGAGVDYARLEVHSPNASGTIAPASHRGILLTNDSDSTLVLRTLGSGNAQIATDAASRFLTFATGQFVERMRIDNVGRVGINTTSPTAVLTVLSNTLNGPTAHIETSSSVAGDANYSSTGSESIVYHSVPAGATNNGFIYGTYTQAALTGPGTLGSATGLRVLSGVSSSATGVVQSAYGIRVTVNKNSGTINTGYGLYLDDVQGTTTYGVYQANNTDVNFFAGAVGIGALPGTNALNVAGNTNVTGNLNVTGSITGASVIGAVYQDVAEWVPATVDMTPGTVVVLNRERSNEVMPSTHAYDTAVAGVVSAQPGVILGRGDASKEQVATTGRVKVHVDATNASIAIGDLLVSSDKPGTAMKSEPMQINGRTFHQPGTILGKALEPLAGGEGEILVLLSLQ